MVWVWCPPDTARLMFSVLKILLLSCEYDIIEISRREQPVVFFSSPV